MTMNATKSVSATFTLNTYTLTATKAGTGSGSLTAPGLSCVGNTCTGTYNYNETVHITATADTGSVFGSWSGCDSVNGNVCTILINGDKNITATFYLEYTLWFIWKAQGMGGWSAHHQALTVSQRAAIPSLWEHRSPSRHTPMEALPLPTGQGHVLVLLQPVRSP